MNRPTRTQYFMEMVEVVATRGTCVRRKTGCILVNDRHHVVGTGYNGRPTGFVNCLDNMCAGADHESGEGLDKCEAIHAEANALLQCNNVYEIKKAYCTTSTCIHCIKLLLNTSCQEIIYIDEYPHARPKEMWLEAGRIWTQYDLDYVKNTFVGF